MLFVMIGVIQVVQLWCKKKKVKNWNVYV